MHQLSDVKGTGADMSAAIVFGIVTGERQSPIGQFFPLYSPIVTVKEVFAKVTWLSGRSLRCTLGQHSPQSSIRIVGRRRFPRGCRMLLLLPRRSCNFSLSLLLKHR